MRILALAGALALVSSSAFAQAPGGAPPRDQAPATGTSRLRGRVVAADTGQPLRKAIVRINAQAIREGRSTTTGPDGFYEFKDLPASRYTVTVSKGSYVTISYGQTRPQQPGRPIELGENQVIDKLDIALPRGAVITGRVIDEYGEPVADANVMPLQQRYLQGGRRLTPMGRNSSTNDAGEFRIFGLAPGQYYLGASLRDPSAFGGTESDDRTGYATTYYPGTPDMTAAQRITVGLAQVVSDIQIPLTLTPLARVSGVVLDGSGQRPGASGGMVMAMSSTSMGMFGPPTRGSIKPDGTFTLNGLAPGEYTLRAMFPGNERSPADAPTARITVNGQDLTGVQLMAVRKVTVTGRLLLDAADSGGAGSLRPDMVRIILSPAQPEDMFGGSGPPPVVKEDFTFETQAAPGRIIVRTAVTSPGWTMKSVRYRGADVTDTGIDISAGADVSDVEVELTTRRSDLSGLVTNRSGETVTDFTVLVFPRDRDRWQPFSRYLAQARPDQQGRFRIRTLPPGEYYALALEYVDQGQWNDPDFLDAASRSATAFTLGESETKTLDLRLADLR